MGMLLLGLLTPHAGFALDPAKTIFQYNCRSWTRQNGFPANGVKGIVQTQDGYLWLGTAVGLVRFDGIDFQLQDLSSAPQSRSPDFEGLSSRRQGGLWFGLNHGAFGFCNGKQVSFLGKDEWGGVNLNVHAVLESSQGDLWIAGQTQAARLTKAEKFETILPAPGSTEYFEVNAMCEDSRGRIWLATTRGGLFYWQDGKLIKFPDTTLDRLIINCVVEDKQGQIWVGTQMGLLCYDSAFKKLPLPRPWYSTRALYADQHGIVWAGTSGGGLARFQDKVVSQLRKADGLADDFVTAIIEDQEGSLWVGTRNGLSQISDIQLPTFGKTEGLEAEVNVAVSQSREGGLWIATGDGLTYFDGGAVRHPGNVGLHNAYLTGVLEAKNGDVYVINGAMDVEVFAGGRVVARHPNTNWPTAMCEDSRSVIVAVNNELYRVGTNFYSPYTFANGQKPQVDYVFNMLACPDDSLWLASGDGITEVTNGGTRHWKLGSNSNDAKAMTISRDKDGVIWAGLASGIARLKNGEIRRITREDGLFDNVIYALVLDDDDNFWAHSGLGFFRVSLQALNDFADRKTNHVECVAYDSNSAVKSSDRNEQKLTGCKTLDGRIWFPTAQGVVMINPGSLAANPVPPQIHIDRVCANGLDLGIASNAVVRPGRGELEFHYVGLSYIAPQKIHYRYKLAGYDNDWVDAGTRRSAFYTNLKPGPYRFVVQGCNEDGVWNTTGDSVRLELLPHFYQTGWFFSTVVLAAALGLVGIYRWRVRQLRRAHRLLEVKVEERTAELKNEIEERKRMGLEVERIHGQLMDASRQAGQAEVATSVLHNVGNVLNSVNVSTTLIADRLRDSRLGNLTKAVDLLREHQSDLLRFLTQDERGLKLVPYLDKLTRHLREEQEGLVGEIKNLAQNVEHIKEIVVMQQSYCKVAGVTEKISLAELVESALKLHSSAFQRHSVETVREYEELAPVTLDKHRLLQILVNLLHNAKAACSDSGQAGRQVRVRIKPGGVQRVRIEVADNGVGIAPENVTRIFGHGFTTRKGGHGFGLHSSALAAKEMGGSLKVRSDGLGKGATFIVELPLQPPLEEPGPAAARNGN